MISTLLAASALFAAEGGVLQGTVKDIDGKPVDLAKFRGDVVLVVNTASACGCTPQYAPLQAMYEKNKAKGFTILAFPCNQFGEQEKGTASEIKEFCSSKYKVTFPIMAKIDVNGKARTDLYKRLAGESKFPGNVKWNFTKFLVGRDGQVLARFEPGDEPDDEKFVEAVESALKAPKP